MNPCDAPTVKAKRMTIVLVVGMSPAFVERCREHATAAQATVASVEAGGESAFAMETLPAVVVMLKDAIASSPFGLIARDLGIELVPVADENVPDARLRLLIIGALNRRGRHRR